MKKGYGAIFAVFLAFVAAPLASQQITRVALIDIARIKETYFKDSRALRDFEDKQRGIQEELDRMKAEIKELQSLQVEALAAQDQARVNDLTAQIRAKNDAYILFGREKSAVLEAEKALLYSSESFAQELYREIQRVAEKEGYSVVMDRKRAVDLQLLIWSSPTVDITDKVIESLDKLASD